MRAPAAPRDRARDDALALAASLDGYVPGSDMPLGGAFTAIRALELSCLPGSMGR